MCVCVCRNNGSLQSNLINYVETKRVQVRDNLEILFKAQLVNKNAAIW